MQSDCIRNTQFLYIFIGYYYYLRERAKVYPQKTQSFNNTQILKNEADGT